jgi:hypothetical protein
MIWRLSLVLWGLWPALPAQASSCTPQIDKVQRQVDARIDAIAATSPGDRESRSAMLHRQPTSASIAAAEKRQKGYAGVQRALRALKRAREAEHAGKVKACEAALAAARAAIAPR